MVKVVIPKLIGELLGTLISMHLIFSTFIELHIQKIKLSNNNNDKVIR